MIAAIAIIAGGGVAAILFIILGGYLTSSWRVVRVTGAGDGLSLRIRMNLVTAGGKILREVTVQGSPPVWFYEDDKGLRKVACSPAMCQSLDLEWQKHQGRKVRDES